MFTPHKQDEPDYKRIMLAIFLSAGLLFTWQAKVEWPRRQALAELQKQQKTEKAVQSAKTAKKTGTDTAAEENQNLTHEQRLALSPRITVSSPRLSGSIALRGARFDDLALSAYKEKLGAAEPVTLFAPAGDAKAYFAHVGWLAEEGSVKVPDQKTLWSADKKQLTPEHPVTLSWNNGEGLTFHLTVSIDENYMFSIKQNVTNQSGHAVTLMPYAYLNRTYAIPEKEAFLHEGPIGVMNEALNEVTYAKLKESVNVSYEDSTGWFGIADHFWLTALIPSGEHHKVTYGYYAKNGHDRYQVDYVDAPIEVASGASTEISVRLFAGAKELRLLDAYAEGSKDQPGIKLFDRALDFGSFYFLAKPACLITEHLYRYTGNFGIALILFVLLLKIVMYPMAQKSYISSNQMRALQPEMMKIRERFKDNQMEMHKATRELYKREGVSPAAGCLPILLQLIIFLALFRGLNVMIEMRHAPFYGWIKDLSAPDPSNIFTLFGLVPWDAGAIHLGLLPILYTITMVIQTSMQPLPPDPAQAKMIQFMPYLMLIFFASMPSGFVLYWTWSNILSILQQKMIKSGHAKTEGAKAKAPPAAHG